MRGVATTVLAEGLVEAPSPGGEAANAAAARLESATRLATTPRRERLPGFAMLTPPVDGRRFNHVGEKEAMAPGWHFRGRGAPPPF
ncbi:MAG TPA: hypothetical protein VIB08_08295, partial [Thermoanaerobaculia bacterium]